jgi:tetratricopeptide (TPR) repeat protein
MKKALLASAMLAFLFTAAYSENLTLISFGAAPKGMDSNQLNSLVMENLQDMGELLNNVYLRPDTVELWYNSLISNINDTNTNVQKVNGRSVQPTKLSKVSLKNLSGDVYRKISNYIRLDGSLSVSYASSTGGVSVTLSLSTGMGVSVNKATFNLDLSRISNSAAMNATVKEGIVKLYKLEQRYFYDPARTGSVSVTLSPKTAVAYIPSIDRFLVNGKNDGIPWGTYNLIVSNASNSTIVTNITVGDKTPGCKFTLQKFAPIPVQPGMPPAGNLYLDCDLPGTKFVIVEDGVIGRLPMLLTNIKAGTKTIVIQESPEYFGKKQTVEVRENDFTLAMVPVPRKGSGFRLSCNAEGAQVVLDRRIVGVISNGAFEMVTIPSLHTLTVMKDRYFTFRTNITLNFNEKEQINVQLSPKKPLGFVVTPDSAGVDIYNGTTRLGSAPGVIGMDENDFTSLFAVATNVGYNNAMTNVSWKWDSDNNFVINLSPLYGDLQLAVIPEGANVFMDNIWRGTNSNLPMNFVNVPARYVRVRVQKEGYRTFNTNYYVSPNMDNRIDVRLKEAPARVFVGVFPDSGFDVYNNGEYAMKSGEGTSTLYLDYGKAEIKLNRRGYKTMFTNVTVTNSETMVLQLDSVPGIGEEDVLESASNYYRESARLFNQSNSLDVLNGFSNLITVTNVLLNSEYGHLGTIRTFLSNSLDRITEVKPRVQVADVDLRVIRIEQDASAAFDKQDFSNSIVLLKSAVQMIEDSPVSKDAVLLADKDAVQKEIERVSRVNAQSAVRKMLRDAIDMADHKDFQNAIDKLRQGLDLVNTPSLAADPEILILRDGITNQLSKLARYDVIFSVQKTQKEVQLLSTQTNLDNTVGQTNAIEKIRASIKVIQQSSVTNDPEVIALLANLSNQLIEADWARLQILVQTEEDSADKARDSGDFDIALDKYDRITLELNTSDIPNDTRVVDARKRIDIKRGDAKEKFQDKEALDEARKLIESINPLISDADKLSEEYKFNEAIKLYNDALKKIDNSTFRDNPKVQEHARRIEKRLQDTREAMEKRNEWLGVVTRNWQGFSLDITGGLISAGTPNQLFSPNYSSTNPGNPAFSMNSPESVQLSFHILPFVDFSLGGVFNLNLPVIANPGITNNTNVNVKNWIGNQNQTLGGGFLLGPGVRLPIWSFVSLYGNAHLVIDLANTQSIFNNFDANAGLDFKVGFAGIKVFYQWAWNNVTTGPRLYQGLGAGLSLWLTEE